MASKSSRGNGRQRTRKQNQNLLLTGTTVGVDWDKTGWWTNGTGKPEDTVRFSSMESLFEYLPPGTLVVVESTFESFDVVKREYLIGLADSRGWNFRSISPRRTARKRKAIVKSKKSKREKLRWKKSNKVDAAVICLLAVEGKEHLKKFRLPRDLPFLSLLKAVKEKIRDMRNRVQGYGYDTVTQYSEEIFGEGKTDPETSKTSGNAHPSPLSSDYIQATVIVCAWEASSKREYEKLLGLYAHGYPSLMRSNINRRYWYLHNKHGMKWPEFRRGIRQAYKKVKSWQRRQLVSQLDNPVLGIIHPSLPLYLVNGWQERQCVSHPGHSVNGQTTSAPATQFRS